MHTTTLRNNVHDFKQLEEGEYAQLINGELIMSPAPSSHHQRVLRMIFNQIVNHLNKTNSGEVFCAPLDVFFNDENAFEPDILFVSKERLNIIQEDGIHGAPDLIIEILSVTSGYHDTKTKKRIYEKYGVKEYWIVDPIDGEVIGYMNENGKFVEVFKSAGQISLQLFNLKIMITPIC